MMIHEFEKLTGIQIAPECWYRIEYVYMNCDQFQTKEQIADYYKKHDMNGIEKLYKELKEKEQREKEKAQAHYYILAIDTGRHEFEYRSTDIYEILDALDDAATTFKFEINRANTMKILVDMEFGDGIKSSSRGWSITKKAGEV